MDIFVLERQTVSSKDRIFEGGVEQLRQFDGFGADKSNGDISQTLPPPKFYRIGEVVSHSGFSRQTVHNYTVMGLIRESHWTEGGHRLYDADVFKKLALIKSLKDKYSLRDVKQILNSYTSEQAG
jgi:hypothetical protein